MKTTIVFVVGLLLLVCALTFCLLSINRLELYATLKIESPEYKPLDGQTLTVEGFAIRLPFQRVFGRGRVSVGGHGLRIQQINFVANILTLRTIYSFTLWNPKWREHPDGPVTGGGTLAVSRREQWIEHVAINLYFPKPDRMIFIQAFARLLPNTSEPRGGSCNMYARVKVFGLIPLLIDISWPSYRARATVSVITGFVSERKTTFITFVRRVADLWP